jgi:hypothetical protein
MKRFLLCIIFGAVTLQAADFRAPKHFRLSDPAPGVFLEPAGWTNSTVIRNKAIIRALRPAGAAEYKKGDGDWLEARVGISLTSGDSVRTRDTATTDLFLGENGPVIRVLPDSSITLVSLLLANTGIEKRIETIVRLHQGTILGSVKRMSEKSVYKILTPCTIVRVHGTEYRISADCEVALVSGSATVWNRRTGKVSGIAPGEATDAPPPTETQKKKTIAPPEVIQFFVPD